MSWPKKALPSAALAFICMNQLPSLAAPGVLYAADSIDPTFAHPGADFPASKLPSVRRLLTTWAPSMSRLARAGLDVEPGGHEGVAGQRHVERHRVQRPGGTRHRGDERRLLRCPTIGGQIHVDVDGG